MFLLMVAVAVIILFLVYQKKQLRYLLERKEMNSQFQKELLKTRLESQEETLTKLSAELHDNIGQLLSSSKLLIGVAGRDLPTSSEPLRLADETISKAIRELRSMSKSLSTEVEMLMNIVASNNLNKNHVSVALYKLQRTFNRIESLRYVKSMA